MTKWTAAILALALPAASAGAAESRFEERVLPLVESSIPVAPRALGDLDTSDDLRAGWEAFDGRHGGSWNIYLDERTGLPLMVSGRGIPWLSGDGLAGATLDELEARARRFLDENRGLLGDWSTMLELDHEASVSRPGGRWQLVFRQAVDGVRVENARLELYLVRGRLILFGATHWGVPSTNGIPSLDAEEARAVLDDYLGASTAGYEEAAVPELTLRALDAGPVLHGSGEWTGERGLGLEHRLLWRFRFRDAEGISLWTGEVDAHDGSMLAFYDDAHSSTIRGGVFPESSDGDCAAGGCEIYGFPMPYADYTETAQPAGVTDTFGDMSCASGTADFETTLAGPYVVIDDNCGAASEWGTCQDGTDLGLKLGENCDNDPGASDGNTAAARTAFYHVNRTMEAARFYLPTNTWLQSPLTVKVNSSSSCNAFWNGELNMYGAGNNCRNTAELQGLLVHEWGHGMDQNDGGTRDVPGEAYADIVAMIAARSSCVARGMYTDRTCTGYGDTCLTCTGLRDMDWSARQGNTPATPGDFLINHCPTDWSYGGPCRKEEHCESYVSSEAIYDLATRDLPAAGMDVDSAWQLTERLWYETRAGSGGNAYFCYLPSSNSCGATTWYQHMRVADDDDGDLSNGTPHAAALFAAFDRHDLACGAASDPENQSTSSCPSLSAPVVTATVLGGGIELSWPPVANADTYRVYRGELGCSRQQVPIATLTSAQTTYLDDVVDTGLPRFYRVEAFGTNPACASPVSACEAAPGGARIQKTAHRLLEDGANTDADGFLEPGETVKVPVSLFNTGLDSATVVGGRLTLANGSLARLIGPEAAWSDIAPTTELESAAPHFELTVLEDTACGEPLALDIEMSAANAATGTRRFELPMGDRNRDLVQEQDEQIPPDPSGPVTSTYVVAQDQTLADLDVSVYLTHNLESELIVELTSPEGTTVRLHDGSDLPGTGINVRFDLDRAPDGPGAMADFAGESTQGTWTLSVEDVGTGSTGDGWLRDWTLHMGVTGGFDCQPWTCPEATPTESPAAFTVAKSPDGQDLELSWGSVTGAAGYHVLESPAALFGTGVGLAGSTAGTTSLTLAGAATGPELTYLEVRAVNGCNQEGP